MKVNFTDIGIILIMPIFIIKCTPDNKDNSITINPVNEINLNTLDSFVERIEYFTLGENSEIPLNYIDKSFIIGDTLVIKCRERSPIYFFNLRGEFLFSQLPTGNESLMFSEASDICIFDVDNIMINDSKKRTIFKYNIKTRKITNEWKHNLTIFKFFYMDGNMLVLTNDFEKGLVKFIENFNFNSPKILIKGTNITNFLISPDPFCRIGNDEVLVNVGFHDTIYIVNLGTFSISQKYVIGEGESNLGSLDEGKLIEDIMKRNLKKYPKVFILGGLPMVFNQNIIIPIVNTKRNILLSLTDNSSKLLDYKKSKGNLRLISAGFYPNLISNVIGKKGNIHFSVIDAGQVNEIDLSKIDQNNKYLADIKRLKDANTQNPILVKFEYKD